MAVHGTTTVEAKSGYGLTVESEMKSLKAIREAAARWPGTVVPTLLGAHVVPKEFQGRSQNYVETVCKEMIPRAARRKLAQFVDVFCDRGAFTAEDTEKIFAAAHAMGCQFGRTWVNSQRLGLGRFCALIPRHSITWTTSSQDDIPRLAKRDTVATLVPGANYFLGLGSIRRRAS